MLSSLDLHFFYVVATSKSLSDAAKKLNVTAPTVTQRLQNLESRLALKLVERSSRNFKLTASGHKLVSRCQAILDDIDSLTSELKGEQETLAGTLTVLAPIGFGEKHVAPLIGRFSTLHPDLNIKLLMSDNPDLERSPDADIVIYIGELKNSSLHRVVLAKNRRLICASPDYLAKCGNITTPESLKQQHCIGLVENDEDTLQWPFTHRRTGQQINVRIQPRLVCNIADAVKVWALDGLGIIHRSEWDVAEEIRTGRLQELLTDYRLPDADIVALLSDVAQNRPKRVNVFVDYLKASLATLNT